METKLSKLRPLLLWLLLVLAILVALWPWVSMRKIDSRLTENPPNNGIVAFELACSADSAQKIIDGWGPELSILAGRSIKIDFIFIPAYVLLFFSITMLFTFLVAPSLARIMRAIALIPIVSGLCDVTENIFLLLILKTSHAIPAHYPLVASTCATIKFSILGLVVLSWIVMLAAWLVGKVRKAGA